METKSTWQPSLCRLSTSNLLFRTGSPAPPPAIPTRRSWWWPWSGWCSRSCSFSWGRPTSADWETESRPRVGREIEIATGRGRTSLRQFFNPVRPGLTRRRFLLKNRNCDDTDQHEPFSCNVISVSRFVKGTPFVIVFVNGVAFALQVSLASLFWMAP